MKYRYFLILMVALAVAPVAAWAQAARPAAVIIFDASNSMWTQIDGVNKVSILRQGLDALFDRNAADAKIGVMTYGHREANSCAHVETLVSVGEHDAAELSAAVKSVNPAKGATPLAYALEQAAAEPGLDGPANIILITDGNDNCRKDPCATARDLHGENPDLKIHVIGFGRSAKSDLKDLNCIAADTGGAFYLTASRGELDDALKAVGAIAAAPRNSAPALLAAAPNRQPFGGDTTGSVFAGSAAPAAPQAAPQRYAQATQLPAPDSPPAVAAAPSGALNAIQSQVDREDVGASGSVRLGATLTDGSPMLKDGLLWRVFASKPDADGSYKVVARSEDGNPVFELAANKYIVHLAYGRANATREILVHGGNAVDEVINLDAGGLRLRAVLPSGKPIADNLVTYAIYAPEQDQFGERKVIMPAAEPGKIIRLNAGNYHVVSQYGDANAVVRANVAVQAGRLSEAVVNHSASKITLKLVNEPGGEALANTSWSILTLDGDIVAESVGAFPSHIVAAGTYSVLARHEGKGYNKEFTVQPGLDQEVELVATE